MRGITLILAASAVIYLGSTGAANGSTDYVTSGLMCIHQYEGAWNANTGNGYYGGLQMDYGFMQAYGSKFLRRWGTANNWPVWAQLQAGRNGYRARGGWSPWPNTARYCHLM
jgi:hypothetical protein